MALLLNDLFTRLIDPSDGPGVDPSSGFTTSQWPVYLGRMPDDQDRSIGVFELAGPPPEVQWELDYPNFMIIVRGAEFEYEDARNKIQDIFNQLHNNEAQVGTNYVLVLGTQSSPNSLGEDEQRRPVLSWQFKVVRDR